ncbi:hypothetical protein FZC76_14130 [Sutcliffiella horikoshii]|uniref:DUF3139 domain-containing protein n=1 Tax=Sutcliffiella horikoshii TaxID=79883 RepID=A0A5D4SYG4_9BACI|nr:hypothetical protein [Sutcliffiella horikoshii]TYS67701.1 hypothetical protein FZC76_14130 [Sutcliffiella horikoshii]
MKKYNVQIGIVLLVLLAAIFINPKELYYSFQAEKEIEIIRGIVEEIGDEEYKVKDIKHIGGNSYIVETNSDSLLIQSNKEGRASSYEIYVYGLTIERFMNK